MIQLSKLAILAVVPWLMAAMWMDEQPSYKPYEAPVLSPPRTAVPVSGKEPVLPRSELRNPLAPDKQSLAQGKALFDINCALCHGHTSATPGSVGQKLKPPAPGLDHSRLQNLADADIFKAITFGFGRMPPFQDKLAPRERWSLVIYLRTRK
jgi:mono/diheme cytochrome c family protein